MRRVVALGFLTLAALALLAIAWLARLQAAGPAHATIELPGGLPATFYLPQPPGSLDFALPNPLPPDERPPAVIVAHGFAADRAMMSTLARRIARNGYAVLAIDFHGHGANRNPFPDGFARPNGVLTQDLATAARFLRESPWVDGTRLALVGHSMGAWAVLDYATRDPHVTASVLISGGSQMLGPERPRDALFLWASGDPPWLRKAVRKAASRLAGLPSLPLDETRGDVARGTAVRAVEIAGNDHVTILWSSRAADAIVRWLDASFGRRRAGAPALEAPRLRPTGTAGLLFILLLPGIGLAVGALAPADPPAPLGRGRAVGLVSLAAALVATLPLVSAVSPAGFLSLTVGDLQIAELGLVGLLLLGGLALTGGLEATHVRREFARALVGAGAGFATIYALLAPLGVVLHRVVPTPERLVAAGLATLGLFPFFLAFELLLRRGGPALAAGFGIAGRAAVIGVLVLGARSGALPEVVLLLVPMLAGLFVLFEIVATAIYAGSGSRVAAAWLQAAWLAWLIAVTMPIRV